MKISERFYVWRVVMAIAAVALGLVAWLMVESFHKLNNLDMAVVQSLGGEVKVLRDPGWWFQTFPTIVKYPKAGIYICSLETGDAFTINFNNKSTATMNAQIGYRVDLCDDATFLGLHQAVEGNDETIWKWVYGTVDTVAQEVASVYDPADIVKGGKLFPKFVESLRSAIVSNSQLMASGICVDKFNVIGSLKPDLATDSGFEKLRAADIAKLNAEAQVRQLAAETEQERATAERQTEHIKIEAQALMAKEKLDAEREKQNATIQAEKELALAELAKEQAKVKAEQEAEVAKVQANRLREVAEIQRNTEEANLEVAKLQAKQKEIAAQAKQKEIELSGAMRESDRVRLEIEKDTRVEVAKAYANGLAMLRLPYVVNNGGGNGHGGSVGLAESAKTLIDFKSVAAALAIEGMSETNAVPAKAAK